MGALEAFTIILSIVSLIISIVAFFASLKFYRDGVRLQQSANDALTKISEKTDFIQTQVGGMFDKTLDAAIGKREVLATQFEVVNDQLEETKAKLIEESIGQIGAAGEQERKRLTEIVDKQIALIREKVDTTRESAEGMILDGRVSFLMKEILNILTQNPDGLTQNEILEKILELPALSSWDRPSLASLSRRIKELYDLGYVSYDRHRVRLRK